MRLRDADVEQVLLGVLADVRAVELAGPDLLADRLVFGRAGVEVAEELGALAPVAEARQPLAEGRRLVVVVDEAVVAPEDAVEDREERAGAVAADHAVHVDGIVRRAGEQLHDPRDALGAARVVEVVVLQRDAEIADPELLEVGLAALERPGALGLAADVQVGPDAEVVDVEVPDDLRRLANERLGAAEEETLAHLRAGDVRAAADVAEVERGQPDHARRDVGRRERADVGDDLRAVRAGPLHAPPVFCADLEELRAHRGGFLRVEELHERPLEAGRLGELGPQAGERAVGRPRERPPLPLLGLVALVEVLREVVEGKEPVAVVPDLALRLGLGLQAPLLLVERRARGLDAALLEVRVELLHARRVRVVGGAVLRRDERDGCGEGGRRREEEGGENGRECGLVHGGVAGVAGRGGAVTMPNCSTCARGLQPYFAQKK